MAYVENLSVEKLILPSLTVLSKVSATPLWTRTILNVRVAPNGALTISSGISRVILKALADSWIATGSAVGPSFF